MRSRGEGSPRIGSPAGTGAGQRVTLGSNEIRSVMAQFDRSTVIRAHAYNRGSFRFPKAVIECENGARYLLKRRSANADNIARLTFSHSVQRELERHQFPMPRLLRAGTGDSWVTHDASLYELFSFIERAAHFGRTASESRESGLLLSRLHRTMRVWSESAPRSTHNGYHQSRAVAAAWDRLVPTITATDPHASTSDLVRVGDSLQMQFTQAALHAAAVINESSAAGPESIVHGDFHPGNILFYSGSAIALLDFDGVRRDRTLYDIANGALQFGMRNFVTGGTQKGDTVLNVDGVKQFLEGYAWCDHLLPSKLECAAIPSLMIEAHIAEVVPRLAVEVAFGDSRPLELLQLTEQRAHWVWLHRATLTTLCQSCLSASSSS